MERLNNPFVIYGYKGTDYFCDRKKETKQIMQALLNERNVVHYESLTNNQAALLLAIAHEKSVSSVLSQDFIKSYGLPATSSVNLALKTLLNREFVYKDNGNYIVYDRFFAMWLRERPCL